MKTTAIAITAAAAIFAVYGYRGSIEDSIARKRFDEVSAQCARLAEKAHPNASMPNYLDLMDARGRFIRACVLEWAYPSPTLR
jgi:hypothetical protein